MSQLGLARHAGPESWLVQYGGAFGADAAGHDAPACAHARRVGHRDARTRTTHSSDLGAERRGKRATAATFVYPRQGRRRAGQACPCPSQKTVRWACTVAFKQTHTGTPACAHTPGTLLRFWPPTTSTRLPLLLLHVRGRAADVVGRGRAGGLMRGARGPARGSHEQSPPSSSLQLHVPRGHGSTKTMHSLQPPQHLQHACVSFAAYHTHV